MNGPEDREDITAPGTESFADAHLPEFEAALSRAMKKVELRAETTAKFLALADEAERRRAHAGGSFRLLKFSNGGRVFAMPRPRAHMRSWLGGAIAAVLALGCFVGAHTYERHEQRIEAQKQFETAERITDETLARTRAELERQGINLDQE